MWHLDPQNFGVSVKRQKLLRVKKLAQWELMSHSLDVVPLSSGGQMRRVAIAGIFGNGA